MNIALIGLAGMPYATLMPVFAAQVLHGGPHTLGILMTASGLGALAGTVYLASRHTVVGLGKVIIVATASFSIALGVFSLSQSLWLSIAALTVIGAGTMLQAASANTILQTIVSEDLRGRTMAFYSIAVLGTMPIGSLLAGWVAQKIGAPHTILAGAVFCLLAAIWFAIQRPKLVAFIRPIYVERGIIALE